MRWMFKLYLVVAVSLSAWGATPAASASQQLQPNVSTQSRAPVTRTTRPSGLIPVSASSLGVRLGSLRGLPTGAQLADLSRTGLRALGLPAGPPRGSPAFLSWHRALAMTKHWVTPAFGQFRVPRGVPPSNQPRAKSAAAPGPYTATKSLNWAGNLDHNGGYSYYYIGGSFNEPSVFADPSPNGRTSSAWLGLGRAKTKNSPTSIILQAGTEADNNASGSTATDYLWWEMYPYNSQVVITNMSVSAGQTVYVSIQYTNADRPTDIYISNESTGQSTTIPVNPVYYCNCYSAEAIVERTTVGNTIPPLTSISTVHFSGVYVTNHSTGTTGSIGSFVHVDYLMQASDGNILEHAGIWADPGTYSSFPDYRNQCGSAPCD